MPFSDSDHGGVQVGELPAERGVVLVGPGAVAVAERLFGPGLISGQALQRSWDAGAPPALLVLVSPERVEIRVPDREPWPVRLAERLDELTGAPGFGSRLAQAIARLEAWHESDAESGTSPEELARELRRLQPLAPSPAVRDAVAEALEALDDGLPADVVAAALYRARLKLKTG